MKKFSAALLFILITSAYAYSDGGIYQNDYVDRTSTKINGTEKALSNFLTNKYGTFDSLITKIFSQHNYSSQYKPNGKGSYNTIFETILSYLDHNDQENHVLLAGALSAIETDKGMSMILWNGLESSENSDNVALAANLTVIIFRENDAIRYESQSSDSVQYGGANIRVPKSYNKVESINYYPESKLELISTLALGDLVSVEKILNNSPDFIFCAGNIYSIGQGLYGVESNTDKAIKLYKQACSMGSNTACSQINSWYDLGIAVPEEDDCYKGNKRICIDLAKIYKYGTERVQKDYFKAFPFYKKACEFGDAESCYELAELYIYGEGVKENRSTAYSLLEDACNMGNSVSCQTLAYYYEEGKTVDQNYQKAAALHKKGCDLRNEYCCANLADFYMKGQGVGKNTSKALEYYKISCDFGDQKSCNIYNSLSN